MKVTGHSLAGSAVHCLSLQLWEDVSLIGQSSVSPFPSSTSPRGCRHRDFPHHPNSSSAGHRTSLLGLCQQVRTLAWYPINIRHTSITGGVVVVTFPSSVLRHIAEVVLREIGHSPGPELEFAENREAYSLAAGLALGMIILGVSD